MILFDTKRREVAAASSRQRGTRVAARIAVVATAAGILAAAGGTTNAYALQVYGHNLMVTPYSTGVIGSYKFVESSFGRSTYSRCIKAVYGRWESTNLKVYGAGYSTVSVTRYSDAACQAFRNTQSGYKFGTTTNANWWWKV